MQTRVDSFVKCQKQPWPDSGAPSNTFVPPHADRRQNHPNLFLLGFRPKLKSTANLKQSSLRGSQNVQGQGLGGVLGGPRQQFQLVLDVCRGFRGVPERVRGSQQIPSDPTHCLDFSRNPDFEVRVSLFKGPVLVPHKTDSAAGPSWVLPTPELCEGERPGSPFHALCDLANVRASRKA